MKRTRVKSSLVVSIGYDPEKEILELEFTTGSIYRYEDVPKEEYRDLMKAKSIGAYVNHDIKEEYRYTRVR